MNAEVSEEAAIEADLTPLDRMVAAAVVEDQVGAVLAEEPADPVKDEVKDRIKISQAVREYADAAEKFERASNAYSESCAAVREVVKPSTTIVVSGGYGRQYGKHFLLTTDDKGNFDVKPIEVI